jgi:hypothetical protein
MTVLAIDPTSTEAIFVPLNIQGIDTATLRTYAVSMAFTLANVEPGAPDFHAASWASDGSATATITVGPSGAVQFVAGKSYGIYIKVVGGGQSPIFYAGALLASAGSTYGDGPADSPVDAVRFWLQDTTVPFLVSDSEIGFALAAQGGVAILAAALCADVVAGKFARDYTEATIDDVRVQYRDRWKQMLGIAHRLREMAANEVGGGGATQMGMADPWNIDGTATPPAFWRGMHDNPQGHHPDTAAWPSPHGSWGYFGGEGWPG